MEYEVGTHIDLRSLNDKVEVVRVVPRQSKVQKVVGNLCDVGTQFVFNFSKEGVQAGRRIPVSYA